MDFRIDERVQARLDTLDSDEYEVLREQIQRHGCLPGAIKVGTVTGAGNILADGHNTWKICLELNIDHSEPISIGQFDTIEDLLDWVDRNQLARRNAAESWKDVQIEKRRQRVQQAHQQGKSTRQIAAEEGVDHSTVVRDLNATSGGASHAPPEPTQENIEEKPVSGADGKKYQARKPLCEGCRTKARKGQPLPAKCADCTAIKKAKERANKTGENPDADVPPQTQKPKYAAVDQVGHILPEACLPAFEALAKFHEIDMHCRALQKLIDEVVRLPGGEQLSRHVRATGSGENIIHKTDELNDLKRHLRFTRPYSICPRCKGRGGDCKGCDGRGWVSKMTWDDFEDSVKARLAS